MPSLDPAAVDALLTRARRDVDDGLLPSCQLALALDGEVVVDECFGTTSPSTRYTIFSATKPFVSSVVWQLLGEGELRVDQPVHDVIPEFGSHGKDAITLDHVLQHTGGFPRAPLGPPRWATHEGRRQAFADWRLNWEVGTAFEYHPTSTHWVQAELIHAATGLDHTDAVRTRVLEPLGLRSFALGPALDDQTDILDLVLVGDPATPDELEAALGVRSIDVGAVTDDALLGLNDPEERRVGLPGGGAVSTAADVAAFYQALLHDPHGLWSPAVLADATGTVRNRFPDPALGHPVNRTRGLIVAGDDGRSNLRGMGRTVSPAAFGHNGAAGQVAWADPATGLSFSYLTDGRDRNVLREHRRTTALSSLAAVCVAA
ncbi:MAG: serine hydrolase domain-containing protein [Acidimicrobiales bacterium]